MRLCYIKDSYIAFLKQYDQKVPDNKNEQRPYIGVILEIKGKTYYAPLSSPKPKHLKMKNSLDFRKILIRRNQLKKEKGADCSTPSDIF